MYIISCFIVGYLLARQIKHHARRSSRAALTRFILLCVAVIALVCIVYEFRVPGVDDLDYWLYAHMFVGRTGVSFGRGAIAFLLGMIVYALRSRIKALVVAQLAAEPAPPEEPPAPEQAGAPRPGA